MSDDNGNRVVMITGATSGIGHATARRFAAQGSYVIACGRDSSSLEEVEQEIKSQGGKSLALAVDVTVESQLLHAFHTAINQTGRLDVLVNAAGHISNGSIENTSLQAWDAMMNVNLRSVFYLMQLAAPHLIKTGGNIVNVSSVTGLRSGSAGLLRIESRRRSTNAMCGLGAGRERSACQRSKSGRCDNRDS